MTNSLNNFKTFLIAINKPKGIICTHKDEHNRKRVFDLIPSKSLNLIKDKLHSVGRLDYNSQGLLLITNNSKIKHFLESPKNKITRVYKVKVQGQVNSELINKIKKGTTVKNIVYKVNSIKAINYFYFITILLVKNIFNISS